MEELDHARQEFRGILQVAIHDNHGIPLGEIEARSDRRLVAEVSAEAKQADAGIFDGGMLEDACGCVGAAVVDEDDFPTDIAQGCAEARKKRRERLGLIQDWNYDRKEHNGHPDCARVTVKVRITLRRFGSRPGSGASMPISRPRPFTGKSAMLRDGQSTANSDKNAVDPVGQGAHACDAGKGEQSD